MKDYMIKVYAFLIAAGSRTLEDLPEIYRLPVAEFMAPPKPAKKK